ncbi:MAG: MATE family efflux transporter [Clostridium sp.]
MQNRKVIRKEILILIIPIIIENILQILAGIVSTSLVGRLTPLDISAQSIAFRITDVLFVLWKGIAIGAMIYIAKCYGEGKFLKSKQAFQNVTMVTVGISIICQIVLWVFPMALLGFFTKDAQILESARGYMNIVAIGLPFLVIMQLVTATFQAFGDTKTPMGIAVLINIINIILGYFLIFVMKMGLTGAGVATIVSQIIGSLTGLFLLYKKKGLFKDVSEKISLRIFDKAIVKETYSTGIPAALESMFWQLSTIIMSKIILSYGQAAFAAYSLSTQAETILELPALGFSVAATTLAARAIGRKDSYLFKEYYRQQVQMNVILSSITSLLLIVFPGVFMAMVTDNPELQKLGIVYLIVMGCIQIPQNLGRTLNGTLRAVGYKRAPMYIAGGVIWLIRVPMAAIAAYIFHWNLTFIWVIIAGDQVIRCIIALVLIRVKNVNESVEKELDYEKRTSIK